MKGSTFFEAFPFDKLAKKIGPLHLKIGSPPLPRLGGQISYSTYEISNW
jgi:hypothetical protein